KYLIESIILRDISNTLFTNNTLDSKCQIKTYFVAIYTPEKAINPPSTGTVIPVTNPEYASSVNHNRVPNNSFGSPKRSIGVFVTILFDLAVNEPSSFKSKSLFCFVRKNPGAIALTLNPVFAKCVAIHIVKLLIPAFAAL